MSSVSQLSRLQTSFQNYLTDSTKSGVFVKNIIDDAKVGAQKRLNIYYEAYRYRIIEALSTAYPKLKVLVGADLFEQIAQAYITDYPSTYQNIRWYGSHMREHLLNFLPEHPIAAEMAAFEWALSLAFDAQDVPELTLQDLAEIPPEEWTELSFKFQPAIQVVRLRWNIIPIWKALNGEEVPPNLIQNSSYTSWLISRKDLNTQFRSMNEMEVIAQSIGSKGATFAEICSSLQGEMDFQEAMTTAAQFIVDWFNQGLICEVRKS